MKNSKEKDLSLDKEDLILEEGEEGIDIVEEVDLDIMTTKEVVIEVVGIEEDLEEEIGKIEEEVQECTSGVVVVPSI